MKNETVSRHRYEELKRKASQWKNICESMKEELETTKDEIRSLDEELSHLDPNHIREQNDSYRKTIRDLEDEVVRLQRELLLRDGKIQQLEDSKCDLRERYNELREEHREYKRWGRREPATQN